MIYDPTIKQVADAIEGDFTSIRVEGEYIVFVDGFHQRVVARAHYTDFEVEESES